MGIITRPSSGTKPFQRTIAPGAQGTLGGSQARGVTAAILAVAFDVPMAGTLRSVTYQVGSVSAGNVSAAVYGPVVTRNDMAGAPLVAQTASTAVAGTSSQQTLTFSSPALARGQYYAAFQFDQATMTFQAYAPTLHSVATLREYANQAFGAFPATGPAMSSDSDAIPAVVVDVEPT